MKFTQIEIFRTWKYETINVLEGGSARQEPRLPNFNGLLEPGAHGGVEIGIGVGKSDWFRLPSLRTGRAGLRHLALRLIVYLRKD